eukprot:TRINITY_DN15717_c0_g1_i2.p1 TRINITY_DN15717_c0_g1~~TRINITY_DN15717_c0_g1_i2.p1  ORF type:complete len:179 (+),score=29.95 TRINITY_DN15717_c0_g1_i2:115-651(+)
MNEEEWINGVVPNMLELIESIGETRGGVKYLELKVIKEKWEGWGEEEVMKLVKAMAGRRLVSRVAGRGGEELRCHPDARKMHEVFMQRLQAFEEEEEIAFIEEETMADQAQEGIHQEVIMPAHLANRTLSTTSLPPTPPTTPAVPLPPSLDGFSIKVPTVESIRKIYEGDDIRLGRKD